MNHNRLVLFKNFRIRLLKISAPIFRIFILTMEQPMLLLKDIIRRLMVVHLIQKMLPIMLEQPIVQIIWVV
ncbi:hypothetical protein BGC31_00100 [Komagataeibacter xylinus]|nr:hypothetical protein BFX83_00090 [Komagataeibacter xylinus]RFP04027.1 hypothetical protein BGC31_00100 [Komagataeibacter xylinus]